MTHRAFAAIADPCRRAPALALAVALLLGGCAILQSPRDDALAALSKGHWQVETLAPDQLPIFAAIKPAATAQPGALTVYLEGDGRAWASRFHPSADPTPEDPIGLRLALADPQAGIAYLGRPCQFAPNGDLGTCGVLDWTHGRFSPRILKATNAALNHLKQQTGSRTLTLVGYSGGGAIALLAAAQRNDVIRVITVAGNLDTDAWIRHHGVSPLTGSLNPADFTGPLSTLAQVHLVGGDDDRVPPAIAKSYLDRLAPGAPAKLRTIDGFDHACCWVAAWPGLADELFP